MLLLEIVAESGNFHDVKRILIRGYDDDYVDINKRIYETMLKYKV